MIYKDPYAKVLSEITKKSWQDADFKKRLQADPKAVIQDHGIEVPAALTIKVVEDPEPNTLTLHLPPPPGSELSDKDLEAVNGGKGGTATDPFTGIEIKY